MAKVLIVEDNKDLSAIYKSELDFNGFETFEIATAGEMMQSLDDIKPDLVLMDIMLSDGSGIELLKKIKASQNYNGIKIVLMSNIDAPAVINEAYASGADGYLIKSMILPSQLTDEVKNFLK